MCFGENNIKVIFTIDLDVEPIRKMQTLFHKEQDFIPSFHICSIYINKAHPASQQFVDFLVNLAINEIPKDDNIIRDFEIYYLSLPLKKLEFKSDRLDLNFKGSVFGFFPINQFRIYLFTIINLDFRYNNHMLDRCGENDEIREWNGKTYICQNLQGEKENLLYGISQRGDERLSIPIGWNDSVLESSSQEFETIRSENLVDVLEDIYEKKCGKLPDSIAFARKKIEMTIHSEKIIKIEIGRI